MWKRILTAASISACIGASAATLLAEEASYQGRSPAQVSPVAVLRETGNKVSFLVRDGDQVGVVAVSRPPLSLLDALNALKRHDWEPELENDIYGKYETSDGSFAAETIFPANSRHISKAQSRPTTCLLETANTYENATLPYLVQAEQRSKTRWVDNIVNGEAEVDRVVEKGKDWAIVKDMKGDSLPYVLALFRDESLRSIRDLRGNHVELLKEVRDKGVAAIKREYGVSAEYLRVFVHYVPSYFRFHIHFTHSDHPIAEKSAGRAILLDEVISHLERDSDHYKNADLVCCIPDNHSFVKVFKEFQQSQSGNES